MKIRLMLGDCLEVLKALPDSSVDAVVTDPPAGIGFMGKEWDSFGAGRPKGHRASEACLGGHGFIDGGDRLPTPTIGGHSTNPTCRRCRRRQRTWNGGPPACDCESPDLNRGRAAFAARDAFVGFLSAVLSECYRVAKPGSRLLCWSIPRTSHWTGLAVEEAGWQIEDVVAHVFGSGFPKHKSKLKPAREDWWLAIKPDRRATPLNIGDCRVEAPDGVPLFGNGRRKSVSCYADGLGGDRRTGEISTAGRWPANIVFDEEAGRLLDGQSGDSRSRAGKPRASIKPGDGYGMRHTGSEYNDAGGASRFFYCPKAPKSDRGEGNTHPTVKHTELMRWLIRLVARPPGVILDPFLGSGSTGKAAVMEGFEFVGVEREEEYMEISRRRIEQAENVARTDTPKPKPLDVADPMAAYFGAVEPEVEADPCVESVAESA